ncbi:hypothetical protein SKAU_G00010010 [Synaphobranchus kaupii]|uniref:Uncharacterized protein n=1 Tax=Synaphobranchus kaupii TaxID=118154 RepID=A0A9Q1GAY9_SYNKA|nr:hypothetical protein SKAU_G00010010 [Synaphobranchus kaupii]
MSQQVLYCMCLMSGGGVARTAKKYGLWLRPLCQIRCQQCSLGGRSYGTIPGQGLVPSISRGNGRVVIGKYGQPERCLDRRTERQREEWSSDDFESLSTTGGRFVSTDNRRDPKK